MDWLLWIPALVGHIGLCSFLFNRTHATAWPQFWRKLIEKLVVFGSMLPVILLPGWLWWQGSLSFRSSLDASPWLAAYLVVSPVASVYFFAAWMYRRLTRTIPDNWQNPQRDYLDGEEILQQRLTHGIVAKLLSWVPGNQATAIALEHYRIAMPKLPVGATLKICQLTDLHLTGQIDIAYYKLIIEQVNRWEPDLVLITGDLVDEHHCLDWLDGIFTPLQARCGKFYILGNHDRRIRPESELRTRLERTQLQRVGGAWLAVETGDTGIVKLAGNELPWFAGAESLKPLPAEDRSLRILLSHSPDQIDWARSFDFDLIFCGHTHGGQVRFPVIGPILCPSRYGVRYACGPFQVGSALMHVSRGISGDRPIRINCPPEVGFFTLVGGD